MNALSSESASDPASDADDDPLAELESEEPELEPDSKSKTPQVTSHGASLSMYFSPGCLVENWDF
eukprot:3921805-Rhodomonas_salina.1